MKLRDGPVTLEINGHGDDEGYHRWRDYHKSYPGGQAVVYVHQLVAIADGANPYKVFSDGEYQVHHEDGCIEHNVGPNLVLRSHADHWNYHVNGIEAGDDQETADFDADVVTDAVSMDDRMREVYGVIEALEDGDGADEMLVIVDAMDRIGADREAVEHTVEKLLMQGHAYKPRTDTLRVV